MINEFHSQAGLA